MLIGLPLLIIGGLALLTLIGWLDLTRELMQFLNQLIDVGFECRQAARLRLFHRETLR